MHIFIRVSSFFVPGVLLWYNGGMRIQNFFKCFLVCLMLAGSLPCFGNQVYGKTYSKEASAKNPKPAICPEPANTNRTGPVNICLALKTDG